MNPAVKPHRIFDEELESEVLRRFGSRLRQARLAAGLTQKQLATLTSMSRSRISIVEHGRKDLTLGAALRLATAVKLDLDKALAPGFWPMHKLPVTKPRDPHN